MSRTRRAGIAIAVIVVAWCLMSLAYDKPQWYFIASGIIGAALFLGALGWWTMSALAERYRRKSQNVQAQPSGDVGRIDA
jgi:hypothetical protein